MRKIKNWTKLERHEVSKRYTDWPSDLHDQCVDQLKADGEMTGDRIVWLSHDFKVVDGWQLHSCGVEANVPPNYKVLPRGTDLESFARIRNEVRRHEDQETIMRRAIERRERVAAAKAEGKSNRVVAKEEKVSEKTIRHDVEVISGAEGTHLTEEPQKVTGKDGKQYPATKPTASVFCDRCARVGPIKDCAACKEKRGKAKPSKTAKSGSEKIAFKTFDKSFGPIARFPDSVVKEYPHERGGAMYRRLCGLLDDVAECVKEWRDSIRKGKVA